MYAAAAMLEPCSPFLHHQIAVAGEMAFYSDDTGNGICLTMGSDPNACCTSRGAAPPPYPSSAPTKLRAQSGGLASRRWDSESN